MRFVRGHPLLVLFLLVFTLTWVVWVPRAVGVPMGVVGRAWTWAPAVAALMAAALTGGRPALRQLVARLLWWRVAWQWYGVVILGPLMFSLSTAASYALLGGSWSEAMPRSLEAPVVLLPLLLLILSGTDGLGEELAWRGFALPRLLARYGALWASLVLGFFWSLWHLPLLWTPGIEEQQLPLWLLLLDVTAKSVLFTWVFLHTRGSVLLAVLFHGATNLFTVSPAESVTGDLLFPVLATTAKWLLVIALLAATGSRLAREPDPESLPQDGEADALDVRRSPSERLLQPSAEKRVRRRSFLRPAPGEVPSR
jgi:membrane protease YdiL (CAAX protease family)